MGSIQHELSFFSDGVLHYLFSFQFEGFFCMIMVLVFETKIRNDTSSQL